jgi:hypothetical protein
LCKDGWTDDLAKRKVGLVKLGKLQLGGILDAAHAVKAVAVMFLWFWCQCCVGESVTNGVAKASPLNKTEFAPLPLKLPAPSLGANGALDLPVGPHIEPFSHKVRAPFLAPVGVTNVAFGKRVTASVTTPVRGKLSMITDGSKEAFDYDLVELTNGVQWVQIDLERDCVVHAILLWHDHFRFLIFRSVVVQAADDVTFTKNVRTIFNNDYQNLAGLGSGTDKQYFEDYKGKLIDAKGIKARYFRFYSNGSNYSPLNGYTEIEAWGFSGADK